MQVAIGTYEHTKGLKDGSVSTPGINFEFVEVSPITRAFRQMATQQTYDIAEMALYLAAHGDYITGQIFVVDGGQSIP